MNGKVGNVLGALERRRVSGGAPISPLASNLYMRRFILGCGTANRPSWSAVPYSICPGARSPRVEAVATSLHIC